MKVFNAINSNWDSKVNFVDENNVVLGYDLSQCCCESADWFINDTPVNHIIEQTDQNPNLDNYRFDIDYFRKETGGDFDGGGIAIFRITDGINEKFIHIYNSHNGYYSHGFTFDMGDKKLQEDSL